MGCLVGSAVVCANALSLFNYQHPPLGTSGCYHTHRVEISAFDFALLCFYEMVILSLSIFQVWHHRRGPGSNLLIRLYWDGIIYVVCILAMSTANIVVIVALSTEYAESARTLQAVLHSVLSSRLLFNLRTIVQHQRDGIIQIFPQTSIRFERDIPLYSKDITPSH
ncbi:hypothetical protein M405DRAFT_184294 [Rhizopogon salebrosus TDB-379]|nr:hypothetical protein M405DRAFT_184294 [Rhizopogon salebrosus TDB-379]